MESITEHLERLRESVLELEQAQKMCTADIGTPCSPLQAKESTCIEVTSPDSTEGTSTSLMSTQRRLAESLSQLAAVRAAHEETEEVLRCTRTSLELVAQENASLERRCIELEEELRLGQEEGVNKHHTVVRAQECQELLLKQLLLLRGDIQSFEDQWDGLQRGVETLRCAVEGLRSTNAALQIKIQSQAGECAALGQAVRERELAQARYCALNEERTAALEEEAALLSALRVAKQQVEEGVQYWESIQEEHEALRGALSAAQEASAAWESKYFLVLSEYRRPRRESESPHRFGEDTTASVSATKDCLVEPIGNEMEHTEENACQMAEALSSSSSHLLEAKAVDLALCLHDAQVRATLAEQKYDLLATTIALDSAAVINMKSTVCTLQPQMESLTHINEDLLAKVTATEHTLNALVELHHQLLDEHTTQTFYCYELETQLALNHTRCSPRLRRETLGDVVAQQRRNRRRA